MTDYENEMADERYHLNLNLKGKLILAYFIGGIVYAVCTLPTLLKNSRYSPYLASANLLQRIALYPFHLAYKYLKPKFFKKKEAVQNDSEQN